MLESQPRNRCDKLRLQSVMERQQAEKKFNLEPITCPQCKQEQPNYRYLLMKNQQILCFACATATPELIASIQAPLKDFYQEFFRKLPLPDYKFPKACLEILAKLRLKVRQLMGNVKTKISAFENQLEDLLTHTEVTCQSYLQKVRQVEESKVEDWHRFPPKLIEQEKFIINIKSKLRIASHMADSLSHFQMQIPSVDQIKQEAANSTVTPICPKNSITAALNARGNLFLGTNDGKIFFEHDFQCKSIQAHDSLIRALEYDGQYRLFSGSDDSAIKMWDIRGGQPQLQKVFGSLEGIRSYHRQLTLLQGGRFLASSRGQFDGYQIRIWDLSSFANVRTLEGHDGYIRSMTMDSRGRIISASEDRYLKVWDGRSCELINSYFHSGKILYIFAHSGSHSYCIIDDKNRLFLLDQDALEVYHGLYIGKKIVYASSGSFIYVHIDRYIMIYSWGLDLEQKLDLESIWTSTNIIEMGNSLIITDVHGNLHRVYPAVLAKN